jgi:hypothetical protein
MKRLLAGGLIGTLACLATAAAADSLLPWSAPDADLAQAVRLGRAEAIGVTLGAPEAVEEPEPEQEVWRTAADNPLQLTSYEAPPPSVVRLHGPDPDTFAGVEQVPATDVHLATIPVFPMSDFAIDRPAGPGRAAPTMPLQAAGTVQLTSRSTRVLASAGTLPATSPVTSSTAKASPAGETPVRPVANGDCLDCCDTCPKLHRWYFRAEYLLWWINGQQLPVLAATGPPGSMGILGQPGTTVLFGGEKQNFDAFNGGRFTLGFWCDCCQTHGLEFSGFFLAERGFHFGADSNRFPTLTRPFFNINENREDSEITAAPGRAVGGLAVDGKSQLWGVEANYRCNLCCGCSSLCRGTTSRLDFLAGFRYLDLEEEVKITESVFVTTVPPGGLPPGVMVGDHAVVVDDFKTRNQFYGGQIGLDWELRRGRWVLDTRVKVALGDNHETIDINGFQILTHANGTQQVFNGGLLALPSNIGHFQRDRFCVVPEIGVNLGYQVTDNLLVYVGYNFLYWSNVVRPGQQIDRVLDVNQIPNFRPGPPAPQVRPLVPFHETSFWAQGVNLGLEYRY